MAKIDEDALGALGAVASCATCGSERVVRDAWASWNPETGLWEIAEVFDAEFCRACECKTTLVWTHREGEPRNAVRELNDRFRQMGRGNGSVVFTQGLQAKGKPFVRAAVEGVRSFDAFTADNDPWGEHDFGAIEVEGERVFWKLDYYDPTLSFGSENPANERETHRVLTIMLASEY